MKRAFLYWVVSLIVLGLASRTTFGEDLKVSIRFPKRSYSIGDKMEFQIVFESVSGQPFRVLPEVGLFDSDLLSMRKLNGREKVEYNQRCCITRKGVRVYLASECERGT